MESLNQVVAADQDIPFGDAPYGSVPFRYIDEDKYQYRVKIQPFSSGGFEATCRCVDVEKVARGVEAGMYGYVRGVRIVSQSSDRESDLERSAHRARVRVRQLCREMAADRLLTLTTREATSDIDRLLRSYQKFVQLVERAIGGKFWYICVPEPHPTNPDHIHLHVALNCYINVKILRSCWHAALRATAPAGQGTGQASNEGRDSPGNVDIRYIKSRSPDEMCRKVSRYISKYITKDCIARFNRKRYWATKGAKLMEKRSFWLKAKSMHEAYHEMLEVLGYNPSGYLPDSREEWLTHRNWTVFVAPSETLVWLDVLPPPPEADSLPF